MGEGAGRSEGQLPLEEGAGPMVISQKVRVKEEMNTREKNHEELRIQPGVQPDGPGV